MITTKNPLRNEKEIIGTFAYCIDITSHLGQIQNILSSIHPIPLSTNDKLTRGSYILHQGNLDPVLTNRQMDCLYYFLRGKTAKETAVILRLSKRTVEFYLENLKNQFSCQTKAELIDKAISHGFMNVLPNCLFNQCNAKSIS